MFTSKFVRHMQLGFVERKKKNYAFFVAKLPEINDFF